MKRWPGSESGILLPISVFGQLIHFAGTGGSITVPHFLQVRRSEEE